jgi:hypothetical protein
MPNKNNKKKTKSVYIRKKLIILAVVVVSVIVVSLFCVYGVSAIDNSIRRDRIISIYNSLHLDDQKYSLTYQSIFGDKRLYEWDSSRSYSSEETYIRNANVDITVAELKQAIAKTDFQFYEEPYPSSTDFMYIYKSPKNEYLRVSVSSKTREDDFFNKYNMGLSTKNITTSPNAGPSNVTIKVNLDDNNE